VTLPDINKLKQIATIEYPDIVRHAVVTGINRLRILLYDGSFIDVWFSLEVTGRYSYHWERRALDNTIYRHDNAPDLNWHTVATFPHHFHNGQENTVTESHLNRDPNEALRQFLEFAREKLGEAN
jgi:hypothetical protein